MFIQKTIRVYTVILVLGFVALALLASSPNPPRPRRTFRRILVSSQWKSAELGWFSRISLFLPIQAIHKAAM